MQAFATSIFPQTYYLPENIAGAVAEITKPEERSPALAPKEATCILVKGFCDGLAVSYYIYPGNNSTTDFNIRRNCSYILNITINGANPTDLRVSSCDLSASSSVSDVFIGIPYKTQLAWTGTNVTGDHYLLAYRILSGQPTVKIEGNTIEPGIIFSNVNGTFSQTINLEIISEQEGEVKVEFYTSDSRGHTLSLTLSLNVLPPRQIEIYTTVTFGRTIKALTAEREEIQGYFNIEFSSSEPLPANLTVRYDFLYQTSYTSNGAIKNKEGSTNLALGIGEICRRMEFLTIVGSDRPIWNTKGYYEKHGYVMDEYAKVKPYTKSKVPPGYTYKFMPTLYLFEKPF